MRGKSGVALHGGLNFSNLVVYACATPAGIKITWEKYITLYSVVVRDEALNKFLYIFVCSSFFIFIFITEFDIGDFIVAVKKREKNELLLLWRISIAAVY